MRQTSFFFEIERGRPKPELKMTRKAAAGLLRRWMHYGRSGWATLQRVCTDGMRGYVLTFNNGPTCALFVVAGPAAAQVTASTSCPVEASDPHRVEAYFNLEA